MRLISRWHLAVVNTFVVLLVVVVVAIGAYFVATSPVAFQKTAAIQFVDSTEHFSATNGNTMDVRSVISAIPYQVEGGPVVDIDPETKYRKTVIEGKGNCSNMSFGMSYQLIRDDVDFQIVHILNPDGFLNGNGHTVLSVPYQLDGQKRIGIVDVVEGGVPMNGNEFLAVEDLRRGGLYDFQVKPLHSTKDTKSPYYGEFVDQGVIGLIDRSEVESYFRFLSTVYVPLGSRRIEKLVYDGVSTVLGVYPSIRVERGDFEVLYSGQYLNRILALCLLWATRALPILVLYRLLLAVLGMRIRNAQSGVAAAG